MHLIIDIGNTRVKYAVFELGDQKFYLAEPTPERLTIAKLLKNFPLIDKCIVSATGHLPKDFLLTLEQHLNSVLLFDQQTALPFTTKYKTLSTLGLDRIAAIAGGQILFPNQHLLVIDSGTAITFDFLESHGTHLGGNISPGFLMRFKALHTQTDKLPLIQPESPKDTLLGTSTHEAIEFGIYQGMVSEIEGYINKIQANYNNLTVILTGGDAQIFANTLKKTIFVVQNLVSIGLNTILKYNVENN